MVTESANANDGGGPLTAVCPTCGAQVTSIEAPVVLRASGSASVLWGQVCYCRCGAVFVPPETERLLRALGTAEDPPSEQDSLG